MLKSLLRSFFLLAAAVFVFSGQVSAATSSAAVSEFAGFIVTGDNIDEVIPASLMSSIVKEITPKVAGLKSSLSPAVIKSLFGKLTATEKQVLIHEEPGLKMYLCAALKGSPIPTPVLKLKMVMEDKTIIEGKPDTISGTLSFNISYRLDGYLVLALDSESQTLVIDSAELGEKEVELRNVAIAFGVLPHNKGKVEVTGQAVIEGVTVDITTLGKIIEFLSKAM